MKTFAIIVLSVILAVQCTSAIPRQRRDAEEMPQLSPEGAKKRAELHAHLVEALSEVALKTLENEIKNFEEVVKQAQEIEPQSDAMKVHLQRFTDVIEESKKLSKDKTEEALKQVFMLFGKCAQLSEIYNELAKPTEEEIVIKRLMEKNGGTTAVFQFLIDFVRLRDDFEKSIKQYIDSLSEEDKAKETTFMKWFKKFEAVIDFKHFGDVTMEVFRFFDADKKE